MNFWETIEKPIIGLSPMDGVTDAPFRLISAAYGGPDIHLTEFTNVEGVCISPRTALLDLLYHPAERPVIAQIYGFRPESFYKVAQVVCELGFDGLDLNMGCPAKNVASKGCGAGLIRDPSRAREIIRAAKQGVRDWRSGHRLETLGLSAELIDQVFLMNRNRNTQEEPLRREEIPVSIKTRSGYDSVVLDRWMETLLDEAPAAISIHGRTLKQMYRGLADWDDIAKAVRMAQSTRTFVLGNGDLGSMFDVYRRVRETGVDGVLIGRAALGNPWVFREKARVKTALHNGSPLHVEPEPVPLEERFRVLIEHCRVYEQIKGRNRFVGMRKHLGWYCKGFHKASDLRVRLLQTKQADEVERILMDYLRQEKTRSALPDQGSLVASSREIGVQSISP